ncbi:hypothetical protein GF406_09440 [candidate division KSB1 bacterium]|nr:hypothetical protein [candidate division KSB1 bacterium]
MTNSVTNRGGIRYLGNNNPTGDREVHDLNNERAQCQIDKIIQNNHAVRFVPDTLSQARKEGFDPCEWCIGGGNR